MPDRTVSFRIPEDLLKRLPTSDKRRSPSRTDFIVKAIREKLKRDERFTLPLPPVLPRSHQDVS